jgi:dicarboxylate transporter DctA-like protein
MRRTAIALGFIFIAFAAVVAALIACRIRLTAAALRYGLSRAGFADARFDVERLDASGLVVARVESGAALRIERCEVDFDWRRLPRLPVDRVRMTGLRVDTTERRGEAEPASETEAISPPSLPLGLLPALELEDAVAKASSPIGPVTIRLDSQVTPEGGGLKMHLEGEVNAEAASAAFAGDARLEEGGAVFMSVHVSAIEVRHRRGRVAGGSMTAVIRGESSGLALRNATSTLDLSARETSLGETKLGAVAAQISAKLSRKSGAWFAELTGADVRLPGKDLHASEISGEASVASAKLLVARLEDTASARRFEPISLDLRVLETKPNLKVSADLGAASGRAALHAEGSYDSLRGVALAELTLPRLALDPKKLRLTDVSPLLAAAGETSGAIEARAQLSWSPAKGVSGDARLRFDDVSVNSSRLRVEGLDGDVNLRELLPPATPGIQTLRAREIHPGVLFSDATLRWDLEPAKDAHGSRLRIERFEAGFADGKIAVQDTVLDPHAETNTIVFHLEALDLAKLFAIVNLEGIGGSGRLSGDIPVAVREGGIAIPNGELAAKGGVLQVRSQQVANLLSGGGQSVGLLLDALRDFHYDELTLTVEKAFEGEAAVRLRLAGENPAVMKGQPFRINLNLTGNLDRLVASLLEVARFSDQAVRATVRAMQLEGHR